MHSTSLIIHLMSHPPGVSSHRILCAVIAWLLTASVIPARLEGRAALQCRRHDFSATSHALQSHISNVQQDSSGFMWFATWNGLVRFDGYNFHTFQPVTLSDGTLVSNRIYNLRVGATGNIWCLSSDNRLFMFDRSRMRFVNLQDFTPELSELKTRNMVSLQNGHTWVTFRDGTSVRMNDATPTEDYRIFHMGEGLLKGCRNYRRITLTDAGDEWVITDAAAVCITRPTRLDGTFHSISAIGGINVALLTDGEAVMLNRSLGETSRRRLFDAPDAEVSIITTVGHRLIAASNRGVAALDAHSGAVTTFPLGPTVSLYRDRRDNVWCFGAQGEVSVISPDSRGEVNHVRGPVDLAGRRLSHPQLVLEDKNGHVIMRPAGAQLSVYNESTGRLDEVVMVDGASLADTPDDIKKYLTDVAGNLWVFHARGADCLSFSENFFTHRPNDSRRETRAMLSDSHGRLWLADRSNHIAITDTASGRQVFLSPSGKLTPAPVTFTEAGIYVMREDTEGNIWMGTKGNGIYRLSPSDPRDESYSVRHYSRTLPDSYLPSDTIYDILTRRGEVWAGSYGGGLSRGVATGDGDYKFSYVAGQPHGLKIRGMMIDEPSETLMIATTDGLVTADLSRSPVKFYTNRYRHEPWGLKGNDVMEIIRIGADYYLCVYGVGVSRIESESMLSDTIRFTNYPLPTGAAAGQIRTAATDGENIWIMSDRTVSRFSTADGLYATRFIESDNERYSLSESDPVVGKDMILAGTSDGTVSFRPADLVVEGATAPLPVVTGIQYQNDPEIYPLNDLSELSVDPEHRSFTLFLSSLTFITPSNPEDSPQFRYRLEGFDGGWNYSAGANPSVNYSNVSPGHYTLRIETLNPDGSWSSEAKTVDVKVEARFNETWLFHFLLATLIVATLLGLGLAALRFHHMRNEIQQKYSLLMSVDHISATQSAASESTRRADSKEEKDRRFLDESAAYIAANIDNPDLVVEELARNAGMSRTAYYTRLKQITGLTPIDFIKQMRIKKAIKLLEAGRRSIAEIAYAVGFADPKYFSRVFKAEMNMTPTQYVESLRRGQNTD